MDIYPDCDSDTLLALALPDGPTCHNGTQSCFAPAQSDWGFLFELETLLKERKTASPESSYTARLYASGTKRIAQKWVKKVLKPLWRQPSMTALN